MMINSGNADRRKERILKIGFFISLFALVPSIAVVIVGQSSILLTDLLRKLSELTGLSFNWMVFRKTLKKEDERARLENIATLGISAVMFISFIVIAVNTVSKLLHPKVIGRIEFGIALAIADVIVSSILWNRNLKLSIIEASPIMESQWRLYRAKAFFSSSIVAAASMSLLFRSYAIGPYIDPAFSFAISLFILFQSMTIGKRAISALCSHQRTAVEQT